MFDDFKELLKEYPECIAVFRLQEDWENEQAFKKLISLKNKIPKNLYAMCLHRLYVSDTEGVTMETLIDAFAGVDRADIMYKSDLEKYNAFPDEITIYRGTENSNEESPRLSWSLLADVAKIFGTAHMFKATISKEDVIAYFSKDGDEEEILAVVNDFEKLY